MAGAYPAREPATADVNHRQLLIMTDTAAPDFETQDRRYTLAVNLECWELLAMHSVANDEVLLLLQIRLSAS